MFEIKDRFDSEKVIYRSEAAGNLREAVLEAVQKKADLTYADLTSADLTSANLRSADLTSANLRSADLTSANLTSANLRSADLTSANLTSANLRSANLRSANLTSANLRYANLRSANLRYADLTYADLTSADLTSADLTSFKNDLFEVLLNAPGEVCGLREKLIAGEIDGSCYQGECACLVGTIAALRCGRILGQYDHIDDMLPGIKPDSSRPAEVWFYNIRPGCTPDKNAVAAITLEWIEEFESKIANFLKVAAGESSNA